MAQISSYPYDAVVQDQDAWIGTDSTTRATKQFTASAVATYLNVKGKISIVSSYRSRKHVPFFYRDAS